MDTPLGMGGGVVLNTGNCALTVDNQSGSTRAYKIDLLCTTAERGAFDAGFDLYYLAAGQHTISSDGIAAGQRDKSLSCRLGSATVRDLIPADGNPQPDPAPTGALAARLAALGRGRTPTPVDTATEASASAAAASATAQAAASASAEAAASASASAALAAVQQSALARTYTSGYYSVTFSQVNPRNTTTIDLVALVTSNDPNTGMAKRFALKVTLLNADGSVDASGTLCGEALGGGDTNQLEFTPRQGSTGWNSIRVSAGSMSDC